jgi:CRP-like cAMP-binding protein
MTHSGPANTAQRPEPTNAFLQSLPSELRLKLQAGLEPVTLTRGQTLFDIGDTVSHAIFPTSGLVSLQGASGDGGCVELVNVGTNGIVGFPIQPGRFGAPFSAKVLITSRALRLPRRVFAAACQQHPPLNLALVEWINTQFSETAQSVVCHRFHRLLERLCRWLLVATDRLQTDHLLLTQEVLAQVLGSQRTAVTTVAVALQDAAAIRCRHGRITILNRRRLELSACECYKAGSVVHPTVEQPH